MARLLSNIHLRALLRSSQPFNSQVAASGSISQHCLKYSTNGEWDTHDDFKPTTKLDGSSKSLMDVIEKDVKENSVVIYMKGVPEAPRCGFSALATKILQHHNAPISSRNILDNPQLKEGVKAFSNWPTFPQVFIKGEFVGGSDILLNMHQNGQLKELLDGISAVFMYVFLKSQVNPIQSLSINSDS